jgi:hypothetical protein
MEAIKPVHLATIAQGNVLKPRPLMLRQSPPISTGMPAY